MLMGPPPPRIARGRENAPQGYCEGLTPVQMPVVMEELVACNAQVQEALADTLEMVQEMAQAGPKPCHCVTVYTRPVRVTTRILACAMVDRSMVIVSLSDMGDVVFIGEELRSAFHLGGDDGCARRAAHMLQY